MKKLVPLICYLTITTVICDESTRDYASEQLINYKKYHAKHSFIQTSWGAPVDNVLSVLTVGPKGLLLANDPILTDILGRFVREQIPARSNPAKGAGASGYFEVTNDITGYTKACVFEKVGKRTRIRARFSVLFSKPGQPDTTRNFCSMSVKLYTEDGIWDLVGINYPTEFFRNALEFVMLIHSSNRNPVTNLFDPNTYWDFRTSYPDSMYSTLIEVGGEEYPDGYRHINGYPIHAFKMVNNEGEGVYVKFHLLTDQGRKYLSAENATRLAGTDPDYFVRDLYNAIASGNYPTWTFHIQVMTFEQAERHPHNPFDPAREWSQEDYPLIEVGKIVLNKNPTNYFSDVEQLAFSPANMIPGIEPSPDTVLQSRLIAYHDAQRYRLGTNFQQLPVNRPFKDGVTNYQQGGTSDFYHQGGAPNYYPNSFGGPKNMPSAARRVFHICGDVARYNSTYSSILDQATDYWNSLSDSKKDFLVSRVVESLGKTACIIQEKTLKVFEQIHHVLSERVKNGLGECVKEL